MEWKGNSESSLCQQNHWNSRFQISFPRVIWTCSQSPEFPPPLASKYQEVALPLLQCERHPSCYIYCSSQHCLISPPLTCGCFCIVYSLQNHQSGDWRGKAMSSIPDLELHGRIPRQPGLVELLVFFIAPLSWGRWQKSRRDWLDNQTISGTLSYVAFEMKMKYRFTALYTKLSGPNMFWNSEFYQILEK